MSLYIFISNKTYRLYLQTNINVENGITLNIGTLASLAPIGPIRLAPTTIGQTTSSSPKSGTSKSASTSKIPKIVSNIPLQGVSKIKTLVPTYTPITNVISHNYRQMNVPDKSGDTKLMSVFTTSGNQIRVNTATGGKLSVDRCLSLIYHVLFASSLLFSIFSDLRFKLKKDQEKETEGENI